MRTSRGVACAWVGLLTFVGSAACGVSVDLGGSGQGDAATCSTFAPASVDASCTGCSKGTQGCQANGCFNNYACDQSALDCKAPGTPCSATGRLDAR